MPVRYLLRRLAQLVLTLWVVVTIVFLMFRLIPGDPASALIDPTFPATLRAEILARFGLDRPLHEQYLSFLSNAVRGDFGYSFYYSQPVETIIGDMLINTVLLALATFVLTYLLGVAGGVLLAWKRGTPVDTVGSLVPLVFRAAPVFWTGMLVLMIFSYRLDWFPHAGLRTPGYVAASLWDKYASTDFLRHLFLPAVVSTLYYMGFPMLLVRNSVLSNFGEEYVEFARARGMSEARVMFRHVLRNALLPVVTSAATFLGLALGGQIIVEYTFSWPGLGREIVMATQRRDYPVAQAMFLLLAVGVGAMNLFVDLLYGYLDPRVRLR